MSVTLTYTFGSATRQDQLFPVQVQANFDALNTGLSSQFISGIIVAPSNTDYRVIERLPFGATFTSFAAKNALGVATVTLKVNTTAVTNGVIAVVSSVQVTATPTALNVAAAADTITITVSDASASPTNLSWCIHYSRT